jgi:hypothetical protein
MIVSLLLIAFYLAAFLLFLNVENYSCACNDQSRCVHFGPIVSYLIVDGRF